MKLPNNIFDSALDLSKRKYKIICILIILFALIAETAIFTFQSYYDHLEDGLIIDSDCMIASCVAQQLVDQGTSWSTLYTGRYRAYLDILFYIFPILTIGLGTLSGYIIGSFLYSLFIIVFACNSFYS